MATLSSSEISSSDLDDNTLYLTSDGHLLYKTTDYIGGVKITINNATVSGNITVIANTENLQNNTPDVPFVSPNDYDSGNTYTFTEDAAIIVDGGLWVEGMNYMYTPYLPLTGIPLGHGTLAEMTFNEGTVTNVSLSDIDVANSSPGQVSYPLSFTLYDPYAPTDTTAPVITLVGSANELVQYGKKYIDEGAIATDDMDGDLTSSIITVNSVDTNTIGTYTITYNVSDAAGNVATEVTRTVRVMIFSVENIRSGFLPKSSVSLNGVLSSKNASPFKTGTVPQGSGFSLNRFQARKNVGLAPKYNDSSMRTQMLRIKAQKPKSIANGVLQSYKNVNTSYKDAKRALAFVRR